MPVSVNLPDFALNGRFGPFNRHSFGADLLMHLGPSDPETTCPGCYSYGNFAFEVFPGGVAKTHYRLRAAVCIPHPEHFHVPYESWKANRQRFWNSLEHDYPDSRFDCVTGDLVQGATIADLKQNYLLDAVECEYLDSNDKPRLRGFRMPSGVTMLFSNYQSAGEYVLHSLDTLDPWGPDIRQEQALKQNPQAG